MPVFHIYRNGKKIASEEFEGEFFIIETDDQSAGYWYKIGGKKGILDIGQPVAWIGNMTKIPNNFSGFILEPCELILDNTPLPNATDEKSIDFAGKEARFLLHDYEFVCQFPPLEEWDQSV